MAVSQIDNIRKGTAKHFTVTMHGAPNALISFTDNSGSHITALNASGNGECKIACSSGSQITFEDTTVSKNPSNISQNYTKSIEITNATTDIYIMPDKCLYWFGWSSSNFGDLNTTNGWTPNSNYTFKAPTHNTNSITLASNSSSSQCGIGSINTITVNNSMSMIAKGITAGSSSVKYCYIGAKTAKSLGDTTTVVIQGGDFNSTTMAFYSIPADQSYNNVYGYIYGQNGRKMEVYALYYD